jgi:hypothetical protein
MHMWDFRCGDCSRSFRERLRDRAEWLVRRIAGEVVERNEIDEAPREGLVGVLEGYGGYAVVCAMPPYESIRRGDGNRIRNEFSLVAQICLSVVLAHEFSGHEKPRASGGITDWRVL